ncbi:MAG: hypothetical protein QW647_04870, partial [Candidatus Bathyarchaeia archaeon]
LDFLTLQLSIYKFHSSFPFYQGALRVWLLLLTGIIGPETRTTFIIDEETGEVIKTVITKGFAITYSFNPLTWSISVFAVIITLLRTFNEFKEWRIISFWFLSFMIPLSSGLVLEHHILTFMPSFTMSIAYMLRDGYINGERREKTLILVAIILYLSILAIWYNIRIPHFIAK